MKILIVEDEFITKEFLRNVLIKYGDCDVVSNGQQAIDIFDRALKNNPYHLVCMDIMMPVMDGKVATSKIREIEKKYGVKAKDEVKILMITALDDPKTVIESMFHSGATAYIAKPLSKEKLLHEIEKLFDKS